MEIEENDFFHQATLCICGELEIEKALHFGLQFLSRSMPADRIYLQCFDSHQETMRTIAFATSSRGEKLDLATPMSAEAVASLENLPEGFSPVLLLDPPQKEEIGREILRAYEIDATSLLIMPLSLQGRFLGCLILVSQGEGKYLPEHVKVLTLFREPFMVAMSNALEHRKVVELKEMLTDNNRFLQRELRFLSGETIIGADYGLKGVMEKISQVAQQETPVLLLGETGTGKEVMANTIHCSSRRREGPFVKVNCGAIPETLMDSELFGHEKGAFTGALSRKRGRFERAHKGTIFLDEIAELPPQAQTRLLRVLQAKEIERVGGTETLSVDIRVIAATHRDLEKRVKRGEFRQDLWFRLNVFPVAIPPLRERRRDIPLLVHHFIALKSRELKLPEPPALGTEALKGLIAYPWPGNIRELQNVVERELILSPKGPLKFDHLLGGPKAADSPSPSPPLSSSDNLDAVVSHHIRQVLEKTGGKIHGPGGAAELLGIHASTLRNRMNKLGIEYRGKRNRQPDPP